MGLGFAVPTADFAVFEVYADLLTMTWTASTDRVVDGSTVRNNRLKAIILTSLSDAGSVSEALSEVRQVAESIIRDLGYAAGVRAGLEPIFVQVMDREATRSAPR